MTGRRNLCCAFLVGALFVGTSGCDALVLPSALAKLANSSLGDLTADEIRVLTQIAAEVINSQAPGAGATGLTQGQSQAIVNFLDANNVGTFEELQTLLEQAQGNPAAIQGLAELAAAFAGTNQSFDPNNVSEQDLQNIFSFAQQNGGSNY